MNKILLATGQDVINRVVASFKKYTIAGTVDARSKLFSTISDTNPDILLVGEGLKGPESMVETLLKIAKAFPNVRVIYLTGVVDMKNEDRVDGLAKLVMTGIYDIISDKQLTPKGLLSGIENPKTEEDVFYLIKTSSKTMNDKIEKELVNINVPEDFDERNDEIRDNLFVISSIKPGTGKSFLSVNIATAIAKFGVDTKTGKRPRVALVEGDLQNLSLGTLLQIEDDKNNLKTVMDKIGTIITPSGENVGTAEQVEGVLKYIDRSFASYFRVKNLECLVGSQLGYKDIEGITGYHYAFLIDAIVDKFDVIIVDSNSALTHVSTMPILQRAKKCFYVINLDFNNVRNNLRYKGVLQEMNIGDKIRYVLNENISSKSLENGTEELMFTADHLEDSGFELEAKIPAIPKAIFLNRLYEGTPIILDQEKNTEEVRHEILKVANAIYPIKNFSENEQHVGEVKKKKGFFK